MTGVLCVFFYRRLYGIKISEVIEIVENLPLTNLFRVPDFIEGVANLRGRIFTVINFPKFVNLPLNYDESNKNMFIVVQLKSGKEAILSVSKISQVLWVKSDSFHELPDTINEIEKKYLECIVKTDSIPIPIIDIKKLLNDDIWKNL